MKSDKGVSVIISTFNGAKRLKETLKHLAVQKTAIPWEIVLIDNASTDNTSEVAERVWDNIGKKEILFRTFSQPIPGKSHAQELGYSKANYEYLLIVDDDNWLCNTYVQTAYEIIEANPEIGALGGWCDAQFESEKPEWFKLFAHNFAVSKQGNESGDITNKKGCLYGAGMVIRKSHWLELKEKGFAPLLTCRKGDSLSSGGDTEFSYALRLLGYKIWYDERLFFKHFMPKERLNLDYVKRLRKAISESTFMVTAYTDELQGISANKIRYYKTLLKEIKRNFYNTIIFYNRGSLLQREEAKSNFRKIKHFILGYNDYLRVRKEIQKWSQN